ncbi:MAG: adenosylcobinamide-GDP ribazoletransferase [Firmicutes bacterium]|nr:adenosylcobinamide-GDP ribazoletransferase [Bacillota bacterium]
MGFILALQFLTRIPVYSHKQSQCTSRDLARSMAHYPLVGALLGLLLSITNKLAALLPVPPTISAILLMATLVLITGNLHWDGWMDTADGLLSGHQGQRALDIMKDSRVGASGVVWAALAALAQYSLLSHLLTLSALRTGAWLIACLAWSRWNAVLGTFVFPYARKTGGTAQPFLKDISSKEMIIATIMGLVTSVFTVGWATLPLLIANTILTMGLGRFAKKRIGGITGDVLGAMIIAGELVGLLIGGIYI